MTEALVVGQIALAVVVLSAAGLMAKSLVALQRIDLSFEPSRLYVAELALRGDRSSDARTSLARSDLSGSFLPFSTREIPAMRQAAGFHRGLAITGKGASSCAAFAA